MSYTNLLAQFEKLVQSDSPNQAESEKIINELKVSEECPIVISRYGLILLIYMKMPQL
jgi:hypothetical protein